MRKATILLAAMLMASLPAAAQSDAEGTEDQKSASTQVYLRSKLNFQTTGTKGVAQCDFLRFVVQGTFADDFSYIFRQRLNKAPKDGHFMDATDYLYLSWKKNNWEIGGGKHYIACGDYEYISSTYDIYIMPTFYDGLVGMYTYLADVSRYIGTEKLTLQVSNSLYAPATTDLAGFSFDVDGRVGAWEHNWSVNAFEREKGKWNAFQCFGNIFHLGNADVYLDFTHRFDFAKPTFLKDFSACFKFKYSPAEWVNVIGKVSWDYKEAGIEDPMLPDGTDHWLAGGGFEFFPVKTYRNLRLHCIAWGDRGVFYSQTGFSWQLDILKK